MQNKRPKLIVLCVEMQAVRVINAALGRGCDLLWARDGKSLATLAAEEPAPLAILVDNAVPLTNAIEVLAEVKTVCPQARRILISAHCDLGIIVQGLHTGAVQHIVYKPIHAPELLGALGVPAHALAALPASVTGAQPARAAG